MPWLAQDRDRLYRFREGDRIVLRNVFRVYAPGLARRLSTELRLDCSLRFRGGATPCDIDDVIQETFIRAFAPRTRASYDGIRPFGNYLLGIAGKVLTDWYRTDARRARLFEDGAGRQEQPSEGTLSPESNMVAGQLADMVRTFIESLSDSDRVLVELRVFGDRPRREVSERTGYSAMRVRIREATLRRRLLDQLESGGYLAGASSVRRRIAVEGVSR